MTPNYEENLSAEIITRNYELVYYVAQKCVNYRDTGVYKNNDNLPVRISAIYQNKITI